MSDLLTVHSFSFPTAIRLGAGVRHSAHGALHARGCKRPLIVTDRGMKDLPFIAEMKNHLSAGNASVDLFAGIYGNPVASQLDAGVAAYKAHDADAIVAIGGGATLDVAKLIALMAHHPGSVFDYEDGKPDGRPVDREIPFIIAIPTTAGTGSEVGRSAVISDDITHAKKIIFSPRLLPALVLADPELLLGLPAIMTAATGMDAVTHLIEAYLAKGFHPMCDGIALEGLKLMSRSLGVATECAQNKEGATVAHLTARTETLMGSLMGAVAFQKGLGVIHSCAHAMSTVADIHHGTANAVMLPAGLAFNLPVVGDRMADLARSVGAHSASGLIDWVRETRHDLGLPGSLPDVGIGEDRLPALVAVAMNDGCHPCNVRPVSADDFYHIFKASCA